VLNVQQLCSREPKAGLDRRLPLDGVTVLASQEAMESLRRFAKEQATATGAVATKERASG
jgi:hypothetical protein